MPVRSARLKFATLLIAATSYAAQGASIVVAQNPFAPANPAPAAPAPGTPAPAAAGANPFARPSPRLRLLLQPRPAPIRLPRLHRRRQLRPPRCRQPLPHPPQAALLRQRRFRSRRRRRAVIAFSHPASKRRSTARSRPTIASAATTSSKSLPKNRTTAFVRRRPNVAPAKNVHFQHDAWGLDFTFKPIRFIRVPGAGRQRAADLVHGLSREERAGETLRRRHHQPDQNDRTRCRSTNRSCSFRGSSWKATT